MWGATFYWRWCCEGSNYFNPRSPCGERQSFNLCYNIIVKYFNPRSPCGERPDEQEKKTIAIQISIHAPRVGSDERQKNLEYKHHLFQSTLPVWGATIKMHASLLISTYFNPRSPCGERHLTAKPDIIITDISIHAPRVGSDMQIFTAL